MPTDSTCELAIASCGPLRDYTVLTRAPLLFSGRVLTKEELETYVEGGKGGAIYLAILGEVFDVSAGPEYYGKEGGYSFFAGRDASAAYVTGGSQLRSRGRESHC